MKLKKIQDLQPGDVLARDVYKGETLIVKSGTKVSKKIKQHLKKLNIREVKVKFEISTQEKRELTKLSSNIGEEELEELFMDCVRTLLSESRLGVAYNERRDLEWVKTLFYSAMKDNLIREEIFKLKELDFYTYYHSVDVFFLGSLLLKKLNVKNIANISKGLLLHDIGKKELPIEILGKKGKLTHEEFNTVKEHTVIGANILKQKGFSKEIQQMAVMHHERLDGSGYPNNLDRKFLTNQFIRVLMIIDVYSAVTLVRPYRKGVSATRALEVLVNEGDALDQQIVISLMDLMQIYPLHSTVELTNGKKGEIIYVYEAKPTLPQVKDENDKIFMLPNDLSLKVFKFIKCNGLQMKKDRLWRKYIHSLTQGEKQEALFYFAILTDNMRVEDIYVDVIARAMREIGEMWERNEITIAEEHIASNVIDEIMKMKISSYTGSSSSNSILLTVVGSEGHQLPLRIVEDCLEANGWKVFNLERPLPNNEIINFLKGKKINIIGFSVTMKENLDELKNIVKKIRNSFPHMILIAGGAAINENINGVNLYASDARDAVKKLNNFVKKV